LVNAFFRRDVADLVTASARNRDLEFSEHHLLLDRDACHSIVRKLLNIEPEIFQRFLDASADLYEEIQRANRAATEKVPA
jgi:hypothetical protein